jgi:6-hydroxycyclohex-1-ene-1-carbonyl-CoA dehydrogenase
MKKMRAARLHEGGKLLFEDVLIPEPESGEVRIKVAACGICHTDLHYIDHGVPTAKKPPIILGHEISGVVEAAGEGVNGDLEGAKILIPAVLPCRKCRLCASGRGTICNGMKMLGNHMDGGFTEYVTVPASEVISVPDELPLEDASIIADALTTPYHAVRNRARVRPGDRVAIFGCGGIGLGLVQFAVASGAHVIAVDIKDEKLSLAKQLGAINTINPAQVEKPGKALRKETDGGVDIAFEAVGRGETIRQAYDSLRSGGTLCVVGFPTEEVPLALGRLMFKEMTLVGSLGCHPDDYPAVVRLVAEGRIKLSPMITSRFGLEDMENGLDTLRKGEGIRSIVIP